MNMTKLEDELRGLEKRLPYGVRAKLFAYADATLDAGEWNRDDEDDWDVVYLRVLEAEKALLLRLVAFCPEPGTDEYPTARERSARDEMVAFVRWFDAEDSDVFMEYWAQFKDHNDNC